MPRKCSRSRRSTENVQLSRKKKRTQTFNPKTTETDESSFSASAKKIKMQKESLVSRDPSIEYRILNFITVFAAISEYVQCKSCKGNIKFETAFTRGLGFKIVVLCDKCENRVINSSPFVKHSYEINRRFIFVMRILGLGLKGAAKFCGLMDMPAFVTQNTYDLIIENIHSCVKIAAEKLFEKACTEEKEATAGNQGDQNDQNDQGDQSDGELTVSGDGTWKKRGYSSLYGVTSLIGYYTGKIIDIVVKSSYCKQCEVWKHKKGTEEYTEWHDEHEKTCAANHIGSSGKMEVDSVIEMFKRSIEKFQVRYKNYIGDGDSKTYSGLLKAAPYNNYEIVKKECIGHVQKRMGLRLRDLVKNKTESIEKDGKTINKKVLSGKGKLTAKLIDKLTVYYGLAIRINCDSVNSMYNAIWGTYYHYCSTDENPQHEMCPGGEGSWCTWQQALATDKLSFYIHDYPALPADVAKAIFLIYENLSNKNLLERCVGGFTQNSNESYNQLVWKISPKIIPCGSKVVEIAAYVAAATYNEGTTSLLHIMSALGLSLGNSAYDYAEKEDAERVMISNARALGSTHEERMARRQHQQDLLEAKDPTQGPSYGPGIDDTIVGEQDFSEMAQLIGLKF